jgi:hypothetical protein
MNQILQMMLHREMVLLKANKNSNAMQQYDEHRTKTFNCSLSNENI